jgi:hypothetical protein
MLASVDVEACVDTIAIEYKTTNTFNDTILQYDDFSISL